MDLACQCMQVNITYVYSVSARAFLGSVMLLKYSTPVLSCGQYSIQTEQNTLSDSMVLVQQQRDMAGCVRWSSGQLLSVLWPHVCLLLHLRRHQDIPQRRRINCTYGPPTMVWLHAVSSSSGTQGSITGQVRCHDSRGPAWETGSSDSSNGYSSL